MARFNINLLGDTALEAQLATMTEKLERTVLVQAFRKAGKVVQQDTIKRVPVRKIYTKGKVGKRQMQRMRRLQERFSRLRNAIVLKPLKRRKHRVGYGFWTGTSASLGITVKYYYPAHLELGHGPPKSGRRGQGRKTPAHPYIRPALTTNEGTLRSLLQREIAAGIERYAPQPP